MRDVEFSEQNLPKTESPENNYNNLLWNYVRDWKDNVAKRFDLSPFCDSRV